MPTLQWIGKDKVVSHHLNVPVRELKHQYGFSDGIETDENLHSGNKIIHGDNLEALKALLPEYEGKIKCIYIDPPYNTGNENWVYNDNVNDPKIKKWLDTVVGKEGEDLSRHDKWLCMMYPRLQLLHKLLAEDGAIFISLDENETTHLRCIMNEIFGENCFVAQITLLCNPKGRSQDKYFSTNHEYISIYSKTKLPKDSFSIVKSDDLISKEYRLKDEGGAYRLLELRNTHREFSKENRPNLYYPLYVDPISYKVSTIKDENYSIEVLPLWPDGFEGCWTWGKELSKLDSHLLVAKQIKGKWKISRKSYSKSDDGESVTKKLFTIWSDSKFYTEKGQLSFGEIFPGLNKNDFPQPKSVDLIKEIIKTCTKEDDIILDSFAGSGTTAHAVLNLNKQDNGSRKFILIEMKDYANSITAERVKRVIKGYSDKEGLGGSFDYFELGERIFTEDGYLNESANIDSIKNYIYYSETRSSISTPNQHADKHFLGLHNDTAYYLLYEKGTITTLNHSFLSTIKTKAENYIIYADNCVLTKSFMQSHRITFKKIPRDIIQF
ncbi:MAG: site-specific DNA-methyltransferase [Chitinophagaceae bacterium]|nr:site-specific DNA-methyltransferase [Chitinophagaceae bacterium]